MVFSRIKKKTVQVLFVFIGFIVLRFMWPDSSTWAQETTNTDEEFNACLVRALKSAEDDVKVGEIREKCQAEISAAGLKSDDMTPVEVNALERRVKQEDVSTRNLWTITPHKQNYILLGAYNFSSPNEGPWEDSAGKSLKLNNTETKFQVSFKFMLWEDIFKRWENGYLYFAYTQLAMWQLYNREISSPFRDTNYEPEAFLAFDTAWNIFGFTNRFFIIGASHQSNGREEPLSRSWNRVYVHFIMNRGNLVLSLKPWFRIPEDSASDDNPDIEDFLGYGELRAIYRTGYNTFGVMLRNNLKSSGANRGAIQFDWSFPLPGTDRIKGFVQYFNGYGECLLDYNASSSRLGLGFLLTDFL
jgi:phospholipase A1